MNTSLAFIVFLLWVVAITFSPLACGDGCSKEQTRALLEIRNSTNGFAFAGWDGRDCCLAPGIWCDVENGRVASIYLEGAPSNITWYPNVTLFILFDDLEELSLNNMQIGGGLEPFCQLKRLKRLSELYLDYNRLEGVIPSCLGMIENIQSISLSNNRLHGNLPPPMISKQSKIVIFDVANNQLEGVLSSYTFANTSSLEYLDLSNNLFQGNQLSFSTFANASRLYYLDLSNNEDLEIETESPSWVPTFQLRYLKLANCNLNKKNGHVFPSFISSQVVLDLLDLSHNLIEGSVPCQLLFNTSIEVLSLASNKIDGSLSFGCFANRTSLLGSFDISNNNVTSSLPENIGNLLPYLIHVDMSSNALEGIIPWSFGNLFGLQILDLSNNKLSGTIPQSLTRDGTRQLVYLNLSNNKLKGEMLPRDSNMTNLEFLQLSDNQFEGMLSPTISNSPNLVILDIRNNHLSGSIPKWLYDHPRLVAVLLSRNRFVGHLLRGMCGMKSLQVFDISDNLISGGIPSCLDNITFWKKNSPNSTDSNYFTAYDDFSTFGTQSYDENPNLCGIPLPRNCSTTNKLEPEHEDEKEETRIIDSPLFFYAFVVVSYAFGFWVFFGILIINKNWRHIYFRAVDRYIGSCFEMLSKYW
ncbi:hypothetical protein FH972_012628 [Carpinus fangiana]|uniref:Leucine-rich repeat-containing N-terminal plant-type domain-containing protein n=1 Tax=Carpinus fangiana TaxID=176857 RepID=A0A5N6R7Q4_9ROSI|nr:hypothetical protein FH972_012628 [Carpinus fangiana]